MTPCKRKKNVFSLFISDNYTNYLQNNIFEGQILSLIKGTCNVRLFFVKLSSQFEFEKTSPGRKTTVRGGMATSFLMHAILILWLF